MELSPVTHIPTGTVDRVRTRRPSTRSATERHVHGKWVSLLRQESRRCTVNVDCEDGCRETDSGSNFHFFRPQFYERGFGQPPLETPSLSGSHFVQ